MDYYQNAVGEYLRADRHVFVNTEFCIQLNEGKNPDLGHHWYCDVVAVDFGRQTIFLCEVTYSAQLGALTKRLTDWNANWSGVEAALRRDAAVPADWPIRPWLFVPEERRPLLRRRLDAMAQAEPLKFTPRVTSLEEVQPWRYRSWDRSDNLSDDLKVLRDHISSRPLTESMLDTSPWLARVHSGDFTAIPPDLDWDTSAELAHLINAYEMLGDTRPCQDLAHERLEEARKTQIWRGTVVELWQCLFAEHRGTRHSSFERVEDKLILDELCRTLRERLLSD